ncbi:hypothetical protein V502_01237 [Pseudogymnoascus sp. VKM F-4520 (FW-2644)]|nr:hypothetical protein V502_01237 [Pseudogymnoascus sp. VKM F-4520 (FW-2644)]
MELWSVGQDGSIQGTFWYEGGNWQHYQLAPAGSASPKGRIAAVSRIPNSMELWYVGHDGSVQGAFWYQGAEWQHYQLAPPGTASLDTDIAAVARVPNSMEVWFVGLDGSVQDHNWYVGGNWQFNGGHQHGNRRRFNHNFDVKELPDSYHLHGELPGVEHSDVEMEFTGPQTLTIHGHSERSYTSGTPASGPQAAASQHGTTSATKTESDGFERKPTWTLKNMCKVLGVAALAAPGAVLRAPAIAGTAVMLGAAPLLGVEAVILRTSYPPPNGTSSSLGPHNKRNPADVANHAILHITDPEPFTALAIGPGTPSGEVYGLPHIEQFAQYFVYEPYDKAHEAVIFNTTVCSAIELQRNVAGTPDAAIISYDIVGSGKGQVSGYTYLLASTGLVFDRNVTLGQPYSLTYNASIIGPRMEGGSSVLGKFHYIFRDDEVFLMSEASAPAPVIAGLATLPTGSAGVGIRQSQTAPTGSTVIAGPHNRRSSPIGHDYQLPELHRKIQDFTFVPCNNASELVAFNVTTCVLGDVDVTYDGGVGAYQSVLAYDILGTGTGGETDGRYLLGTSGFVMNRNTTRDAVFNGTYSAVIIAPNGQESKAQGPYHYLFRDGDMPLLVEFGSPEAVC